MKHEHRNKNVNKIFPAVDDILKRKMQRPATTMQTARYRYCCASRSWSE
jgi:hypothetical protein